LLLSADVKTLHSQKRKTKEGGKRRRVFVPRMKEKKKGGRGSRNQTTPASEGEGQKYFS